MKIDDYELEWRRNAICQVQIFQPPTKAGPLIIVTELPENQGMSVTNGFEEIATKVRKQFNIDPASATWVEHYIDSGIPPNVKQTWDSVSLKYWPDTDLFTRPHWRAASWEEVAECLELPEGTRWEDL